MKRITKKTAKRKPAAEPAAPQKRIFIVDDHPLFREGLGAIIRQQPELCICGNADNAVKAFEEIRRLKPDIVVTDIGLPGKSGLELLKDIHAFMPEVPILVISMHDEVLYAERVLKAGARGYIMKQEGPDRILEAITKVLEGHVYVSGRISSEILENLVNRGAKPKASPIAKLSDREFEVFRLLGEGKEGHEIAKDLNLSIKTVSCHRANIKDKLGIQSGTALISFASQWVGGES